MKLIVDETKNNYKILRDIPMGSIFAFADETDVEGDDDLYMKIQDDCIVDLKTGQTAKIVDRWLSLPVVQYDVRISLVNKY